MRQVITMVSYEHDFCFISFTELAVGKDEIMPVEGRFVPQRLRHLFSLIR